MLSIDGQSIVPWLTILLTGTPSHLLDSYYMIYCEQAFDEFCNMHWPCNYQKGKMRCANVYFGHTTKGHQNDQGKVIANGEYVPSFHYDRDLGMWIQYLEREMERVEHAKATARPALFAEDLVPNLHLDNVHEFYRKMGSPGNFKSHCICFCCLREVPIHPLACGHILCTPCVHQYGISKASGLVEVSKCPICLPYESRQHNTLIQFKPQLAGIRTLCLDG